MFSLKLVDLVFLGDFITDDPGEWGQDYSDDLEVGKSSESKDISKPQISEAKKIHDDLIKRITEFYQKDNQWGMITNDENEVKKLKSIASKLRINNWKNKTEKHERASVPPADPS